ncbi:hypothetical protein DYB37_007096 [Aphanomyces astaci]|uniref:Uncharacterized protein n=1 Tax=Aphanomyces astaci TaxID=112090 RepID=A0A397AH29_APHAT|nr:hypothetical protein DYB25_000296 [Aphanomyces astaci]RHY48488.1 hypothetical protein DYB38_010014 [Aphanomyces astaci]RHZ27305.1 hypothetical protein DYB37_007096 [Aphanomyces astaci]
MLRTPEAHAEMNDAIAFLQRQIDGLKSKEPQCIEELDAAMDSPDVSMEDLLVFDKGQFPLSRELWNTIGPKVDDRDNDDTPNDDDGDDSGDDADSASSTKQSKSKQYKHTLQYYDDGRVGKLGRPRKGAPARASAVRASARQVSKPSTDEDNITSSPSKPSVAAASRSRKKKAAAEPITQQDETTPTRRKSARRAAASAAAAAPPPPTKTATQRKKKQHHDHSDG